jgi:type IV pilus assembly protein PilE
MNSAAGFTLVELLVTIAIVAILSALAYPSYSSYIIKARRGEATRELLDLAAAMERYYANNGSSYAGASAARLTGATHTEHGYYRLAVALSNANQGYTLTASAAGAQAGDSHCPGFTLTSSGVKGPPEKVDQCW